MVTDEGFEDSLAPDPVPDGGPVDSGRPLVVPAPSSIGQDGCVVRTSR